MRMRWYFIFFLVSGYCSLVYEIVWLRLAMAEFGVTTAMVSIVLSMFMAGLGLGSSLERRSLDCPATLCACRVIDWGIGAGGALHVPVGTHPAADVTA